MVEEITLPAPAAAPATPPVVAPAPAGATADGAPAPEAKPDAAKPAEAPKPTESVGQRLARARAAASAVRSNDAERRERAARDARFVEMEKRLAEFDAVKGDPLKVLEFAGHDFAKAQQAALEAHKRGDPVVQARTVAEQALAEARKIREEAEEQRRMAVIDAARTRAQTMIDTDDAFDLLRVRDDATDLVLEIVRLEYEQTGEEMSLADAAKRAESWLEEYELPRLVKSKKLGARFAPPAAPQEKPNTEGPTHEATRSNASAEGPATLRGTDAHAGERTNVISLSREQRLERAAGKLRFADEV